MSRKLSEIIDFKKTLEQGVGDVMRTTQFDSGADWAKTNTAFNKLLDDDEDVLEDIEHEEESNEQTSTGGASGGYSSPLFGSKPKGKTTKKKITKIPNFRTESMEEELDETTSSASSGSYSTPKMWAKNPKNWRTVMDKKFPKYGGPGGKYVKIKDKCKTFPYCSQGAVDNPLEFYEENDIMESIGRVAKSMGISETDIVNRLVEVKSTSTLGKKLRGLATRKAKKSKKESDERYISKKELDEMISRGFYTSPITSLVGVGKMDTPLGKIHTKS